MPFSMRGAHPLAQVAGVVPAAGDVDVLAVVAAARVVQVAGRVHVGHRHAAALRAVVAHGLGQRAPPDVRPDEERHGKLAADGDLVHGFAVDVAEVADQAVDQVGGRSA